VVIPAWVIVFDYPIDRTIQRCSGDLAICGPGGCLKVGQRATRITGGESD
jgi:hypothetical protein